MDPSRALGPSLIVFCWPPHHHHHESKHHGMMAIMAGYHNRNHHDRATPGFRAVPKCRPVQCSR
eukprot:10048725-Alexandrium_andersonii.AAC.1